jgi:hypothetical protein
MLTSLNDFIAKDWTFATSQSLDELGVRWVLSEKPLDKMSLIEAGEGYYLYERLTHLSVLWTDTDGVRERFPVERVQWGENRVVFWTKPRETLQQVVFAQPAYPGWQAFVDGQRETLHEKDIFMAVDMPAGAREIEFEYRPNLTLPLAITILMTLLWFAACAWDQATRRRTLTRT